MVDKSRRIGAQTSFIGDDMLGELGRDDYAISAQDAGGNISDGTNTPKGVLNGLDFTPVPNPMSDLRQTTYHFSFYLDSEFPDQQGKGGEFVIAETGLTGMNLQDVNIEAIVGPNQRTKNALSTSVTMKIFEPKGAQLPDLLYQAAVTMKISNYLKAPWFLKLKLKGEDDNGNFVTVGTHWIWQLMLIDVASQVDQSGSVHTITAMPMSEVALNDQYCMLPRTARAEGATVGEILQGVVKNMNEDVANRHGRSSIPLVEYAIEDRPYPYDTKVGVKRPFDHPVTSGTPTLSNQETTGGYDQQIGQFAPGTDVPAVVDMTMARSDTAVKMARLSRSLPPETGDDNEEEVRDVMSIMHRVDTQVELREYDPVAGDYAKKITYIVRPYPSLRLLTSMGRAKNFDLDTKLNLAKAKFAKSRSFIKKQYDYLFTGLNTEVEKFDINLNFNWAVSVPMAQGQNNGGKTSAQVDNTKSAATLQQDLTSANTDLQGKQQALDDFEKSKAGVELNDADKETKKKLVEELDSTRRRRDDLSNALGAKKDEIRAGQPRRLPPQANDQVQRFTDGEDLIYERIQKGDFQGASQGGQSVMPVTIVQDANNPGLRTTTATSNDNNANKTMYGALLNQMYGSFDGNLQDVDLDIRGDPYWLGPGDVGRPCEEESSDTTPNFQNGEHMFVFRFKLPLGYDDRTGTVSVESDAQENQPGQTTSNIFTGFYATISVINKFTEGRFTQTLRATRIAGWQYENIIEGRAAVVEDLTKFNDSPGPSSPEVTQKPQPSGTSATSTTKPRGAGDRRGKVPKGIRNNNPANLESGPFTKRQTGYVGSDGRFAQFDTEANGINAHERLLRYNYLTRPTTVEMVIKRYAPPSDNSQASLRNYVAHVTKALGKSRVDANDTVALARAMRQFESPGSN
jgi:hypothetical protein